MTRAARSLTLSLSAVIMLACTDRTALEQRATSALAQRLVGTWDVRFQLDRSPVLARDTGAVARMVRGQLAFLANRWLDVSYPGIETPTDYGTYDIDFTSFGFDTRGTGQTPTVVAGWLADDSLVMILDPGESRIGVTMRGRLADDSISGTWEVSASRASGGGGRFVMLRHLRPVPQLPVRHRLGR